MAPPAATAHADAHDDHHAADAHGKSVKGAPDQKNAAKQGDGHDTHHDAKHDTAHAKGSDAHASSAAAGEECNPPLKAEIATLFDRWNASLRTGDPRKVVANYAPDSVLLPTVSNRARFTIAEKEDYFVHFLQRRPQGYIDDRIIDVDCNSATDAGLYTFRFSDGSSVKARYSFSYKKISGQWLITSHHSSGMPEKPEAPAAAHAEPHAAPKSSDSGGSTKGWVRFP
ncbi:MAG: SgcJ/EcaC family oxidoreductase [Betaproteobacteria bacterium]|nr:SgcJ/EcaC family oxidoreductase [Betaproteobacteria bacterium]